MPYRLLLTSSVAALLLSFPARAAVIYDNGQPVSDPTALCSPMCPGLIYSTGSGVFTLVSDAMLTSARFWTLQAHNVYHGESLTWQILEDDGGMAGALVGSGSFTLSQTLLGQVNILGLQLDEFRNDFPIANLQIDPSSPPQTYFLAITDLNSSASAGIYWANSGPNSLAFQLSGTGNNPAVPEPATLAIVAAGIAACAACRFRGARFGLRKARLKRDVDRR